MKRLIFKLIIAVTVLSACEEDAPEASRESFVGQVDLVDIYKEEIPDKGGIQIEIKRDSKVFASTVTDEDGGYVINDVPNGTFEVVFYKENFGEFKLFGVKNNIYEYDTIETVFLTEIPPAEIYIQEVKLNTSSFDPNENSVQVYHTVYFKNEEWYLVSERYFFESGRYVAPFFHSLQLNGGGSGGNNQNPNTSGPLFKLKYFYDAGFKSGDKISVVAHPDNEKFLRYTDPETSQVVYPSLGEGSNIESFILP